MNTHLVWFIALLASYSDSVIPGKSSESNSEPTDEPPTKNFGICSNRQGKQVTLKPEFRGQYNRENVSYHSSDQGCWYKTKNFFCCGSKVDYDEKVRNELFFARFSFPREHNEALNYPNKLIKIIFNGETLSFDAKLPNYKINNITIYVCRHNYPVLIDINGLFEHTYYSLSSNPDLWTNKELNISTSAKSLGRVKTSKVEHVDENEVKYYSLDQCDCYKPWVRGLYKTYSNLTKRLCKSHKINKPLLENPTLEIILDWLKPEPLPEIQPINPNVNNLSDSSKPSGDRYYEILYLK